MKVIVFREWTPYMTEHMTNHAANSEPVAFLEKELRYISGIIKQKGREILSNYTITPPQFIALQWLFEHGDMTIGDLSTKMYLAFSTTTDLVDRMEKNQLVLRVRNEQDRRVVQIHLLKEGERIIEEVIVKRQDYLRDVLSDFDEQEVEQLSLLFKKLHVEMKEN
jgi:DNA-binding MarR family transcriptional regulator